jgi:hypothetical protein
MMKKSYYTIPLIILIQGIFLSCNSNPDKKKELSKEEGSIQKTDSSSVEKERNYVDLLKKYKAVSFDTLKVCYSEEEKNNPFFGKELTVKEAKSLPIGFTENYFGKITGLYACCQFPIDSNRVGLITRIPAEYESTSIVLFVFDLKKNRILDEYHHLAASSGDAGETYVCTSWLFKTANKQLHSFEYHYQTSHEIDDTLTTESRSYELINCMSPKFEIISNNEAQLKKRFKKVLLTEE